MALILVIEDESNLLLTMVVALQAAGHRVAAAPDGQRGLECHLASRADLIITDIYMPQHDGLELIRKLRREKDDVKILAISGIPDLGDPLGRAVSLGANRTLEKPFKPYELIAVVSELLLAKPCPRSPASQPQSVD